MANEYYIDRIGNVSVQGPVVTIDLGRIKTTNSKEDSLEFEKKLSITLTGQNLVNLVTSLTNTLKAMSNRNAKNKAASLITEPVVSTTEK